MVRLSGVEELRSYDYLNMVARLAWQTWQRLPQHTRCWISIEDVILDGIQWVELKGLARWDKRKASLSTILYLGLSNYYETYYSQRYCSGNQKRSERSTISIQDKEQQCRESGLNFEMERVLGLRIHSQKEMERQFLNCMAVRHLLAVYERSPCGLQGKIRDWFLADAFWQEEEVKWHMRSQKFQRHAETFRELACNEGLTIGECRHIFTNPACLDKISRAITWLPYSASPEAYR